MHSETNQGVSVQYGYTEESYYYYYSQRSYQMNAFLLLKWQFHFRTKWLLNEPDFRARIDKDRAANASLRFFSSFGFSNLSSRMSAVVICLSIDNWQAQVGFATQALVLCLCKCIVLLVTLSREVAAALNKERGMQYHQLLLCSCVRLRTNSGVDREDGCFRFLCGTQK